MTEIQYEELKQLLETILQEQKKPSPPRTSYVVKKKGQLFQVDELRVTEDVPEDVNPKEYAVTEALDLLQKSKAIEPAASGVNNTNIPFAEFPNQETNKTCPKCSRPLTLRNGKNGQFYGCTGYSAGCKHTEALK
jgi:hypothetical protein